MRRTAIVIIEVIGEIGGEIGGERHLRVDDGRWGE